MGASAHSLEGIDGTDNFDFLLSGVPNLVADQDPAPYLPDYHAESDVPERVNPRRPAATPGSPRRWCGGWRLPRPTSEAPDPAEVDALLVRTKLVEQMQGFDQWDDWKAGRRGFPASP